MSWLKHIMENPCSRRRRSWVPAGSQQLQIPGHKHHEGNLEQTGYCVYIKVFLKQSLWPQCSLETTHPISPSVSKESDCVRRSFFDVICSDFVSGTPDTLQSALPFCSLGFNVSDFFLSEFFQFQ